MKLSKIWAGLLPVVLGLMSACSNESPDRISAGDRNAITINFPGYTLAPKTYAGTYPADITEKAISNARILVFDDKSGQPGILLNSESIELTAGGDTEAGVTGKVFIRESGVRHLLAIANLDFTLDQYKALEGKTFADVSKTFVTQPSGKANFFPMCAVAPLKVTIPELTDLTTPMPNLNFTLERLSARIDIENLTTAADGEFVLEGARMEGDIARSYLVRGQTPALFPDDNLGTHSNISTVWAENKGVNGDMRKMYMQLYTYENKKDQLNVIVKGTYKGEMAQFSIPFTNRSVKRNTRYIVQMKNNAETKKMDFNIVEVKDWAEGGNGSLDLDVDKTMPTVTAISAASGAAQHTANNTEANKVTGISVKTTNAYSMKISVESPSMESRILLNNAEYPWVEVNQIGESKIAGGKLHQDFLVKIGKNVDLYPRTIQLEVQNAYAPNKKTPKLITITQPAATSSLNPLAWMANANVDDLNKFATPCTSANITSNEVKGKLYQWGRNIPIVMGSFTTKAVKIGPNDPALWNQGLLLTSTDDNCYCTSMDAAQTWSECVNKSTNAPNSYKGTNGGDPSPNGFHIPTLSEICSVVSKSSQVYSLFQGNLEKKTETLSTKFHGEATELNVVSEFYAKKKGVMYAIRHKGGDNKYLTAFRYEILPNKGLEITARHLGAAGKDLKVELIADESYWNSNAGSDIIRILPYNPTIYPHYKSVKTDLIPKDYTIYSVSNKSKARAINYLMIRNDRLNLENWHYYDCAQSIRPFRN